MTFNLDSTAADEAMRAALGVRHLAGGSIGGSLIDEARRYGGDRPAVTERRAAGLLAADEVMRQATGTVESLEGLARDGVVASAMREAAEQQRKIAGGFLGGTEALSDAIGGLKGVRGIDDATLAGLRGQLGAYDTAASLFDRALERSRDHDLLGLAELDPVDPLPTLPPIPRNPILDTNALLDEQRALIAAAADAQKEQAELLGQLIAAFAANKEASDLASRRAQLPAWLGIVIALAAAAISLIALLKPALSAAH